MTNWTNKNLNSSDWTATNPVQSNWDNNSIISTNYANIGDNLSTIGTPIGLLLSITQAAAIVISKDQNPNNYSNITIDNTNWS